MTYLGTTDTSYPHGAQPWPAVERADVEYLLDPVTRYFDVAPPRPEDCVAAWAGLRPLVAQPGKAPTEISRRDEIQLGPGGVVTVAGGKLTGYRRMAEQVLERTAAVLGALPGARDSEQPLPGGDFASSLDALARALAECADLDDARAARLVRLYGAEAPQVVALGPEPLAPGGRVLAGEADWAVRREGAATLEDVLYRRTSAAWTEPGECDALLEPLATRLAAALGWRAARVADEVASSRARLRADLAFRHEEECA